MSCVAAATLSGAATVHFFNVSSAALRSPEAFWSCASVCQAKRIPGAAQSPFCSRACFVAFAATKRNESQVAPERFLVGVELLRSPEQVCFGLYRPDSPAALSTPWRQGLLLPDWRPGGWRLRRNDGRSRA